jgi:hypothetical protein
MRNVSTVIGGVIVATGLTVLNDLLNGEIRMQPVISGFVVGTFLLILAFFSTPVAAALALLLVVTSVMRNGGAVLAKVMQ